MIDGDEEIVEHVIPFDVPDVVIALVDIVKSVGAQAICRGLLGTIIEGDLHPGNRATGKHDGPTDNR